MELSDETRGERLGIYGARLSYLRSLCAHVGAMIIVADRRASENAPRITRRNDPCWMRYTPQRETLRHVGF